MYRRLGVSQGRSGQVQKIAHPPGLDPRNDGLHRMKQEVGEHSA